MKDLCICGQYPEGPYPPGGVIIHTSKCRDYMENLHRGISRSAARALGRNGNRGREDDSHRVTRKDVDRAFRDAEQIALKQVALNQENVRI